VYNVLSLAITLLTSSLFAPKYMLSSGKGYDEYGLTLAASTMCALQGFWNFIVYARPRNILTRKALSRMVAGTLSRMESFLNSLCKKSDAGKEENIIVRAETAASNESEAKTPEWAVSPLSAAESGFVPFEAPEAGEVDECEVGSEATAPQDSNPSVAKTELVSLVSLEIGAEADELAIGESAVNQNRNGECSSTSPVEEPSAVNEPVHTLNSKRHSRFRTTLMDLRNRFTLTNSDVGRLSSAGGGLDPAIIRQHNEDDDADETIDIEAMFEMLLAG
jgi:hypothetical protein